jgi:hypothetical protein
MHSCQVLTINTTAGMDSECQKSFGIMIFNNFNFVCLLYKLFVNVPTSFQIIPIDGSHYSFAQTEPKAHGGRIWTWHRFRLHVDVLDKTVKQLLWHSESKSIAFSPPLFRNSNKFRLKTFLQLHHKMYLFCCVYIKACQWLHSHPYAWIEAKAQFSLSDKINWKTGWKFIHSITQRLSTHKHTHI